MVDNIVTKPLGLVLIVAAHMVFNGISQAVVTGILGTNITLRFKFNVNVTKMSHFAVHTCKPNQTTQTKIDEYLNGKGRGVFDIYPKNNTVFYLITNLKMNHSGPYWASLFMESVPLKESNRVQLIVQEENRSTTVPTTTNDITMYANSGSPSLFSSHIVTVLVVSPVVLLAAVLPWLIWCFMRTKDKQQQPPQQSSNPTEQETVEASNNVPALVYSVLDFPKRPPAVVEINLSDTEYAAVSYLPERRRV